MQFIDIKRQYLSYKEEINQAIQSVLDSGQFIMGEQVQQLEAALASYVGVKHCIAVSSGTDSLLIALMALGIGPGDEIITVPFTFISTSEVIQFLGAKPVFVDIDAKTFNLDVNQLEQAVTRQTKAILPVNLFGQMADYRAINAIAKLYNLPVIEDGAQSFGASQQGKKSCSTTTIGSTSFFPAKPFGCYGDGGALFTNDDPLAEKMRAIRVHGSLSKHEHPWLGMNGRFDTLQAAILLAKFPHYAKELKARARIAKEYSLALKEWVEVPNVLEGNVHVYSQYTIRSPMRDQIAKNLKKEGVPTAIYYPKCLHEQPVFKQLGFTTGSFPVAEKSAREVLSLPMHPWLSVKEQQRVVAAVAKSLRA